MTENGKIEQGVQFTFSRLLAKVGPAINSIDEGKRILTEALNKPDIKSVYGVFDILECIAWNKDAHETERFMIFKLKVKIILNPVKIALN